MCVFSSPKPPPPDPDIEIERENQEQEEEAKREQAKQDRLEDTVQRAGGGSGGTTVPSCSHLHAVALATMMRHCNA